MIAIIKDRGETYVSPVFAVKGAGWKSEILAFDRDRTRIQRIDMWKRQPHLSRQVFIVKEEAFGCQRMKWTGCGRVLDDKDLWKKLRVRKAVSVEDFPMFKEYAREIVLPEWFEIKNQTDAEDLMSVSIGFHDSFLKRLEQRGEEIEIEFDTSWQCNFIVRFHGVKEAVLIDRIGIIYDSALKKTEDGFLWKINACDAGGVGGAVDFEALPNDPYIVCKGMEWKIEIL